MKIEAKINETCCFGILQRDFFQDEVDEMVLTLKMWLSEARRKSDHKEEPYGVTLKG